MPKSPINKEDQEWSLSVYWRRFAHTVTITLSVIFLVACDSSSQSIKVGILFAQSGTMAEAETPVALSAQMAIEEINRSGGVFGRQLEAVIYDTKSSDVVAVEQTKQLILEDKVSVIAGCWTSSCRKNVGSVVEKYQNFLIYPVQFEGLESSSSILYTGPTISQQLTPAISWGLKNLGVHVLLVGSDYIYPHIANDAAKDYINYEDGLVVDEIYYPLGDKDFVGLEESILKNKPNFIVSTINGDSNESFIRIMNKFSSIPVISTSLSESELSGKEIVFPLFIANSYFENLPSPENAQFVEQFKAFTGEKYHVSAAVEAVYVGLKIWAHAVNLAKSFDSEEISSTLSRVSVMGPAYRVNVSIDSKHVWRPFYLSQYKQNGLYEVVDYLAPLRPNPFPITRTNEQWRLLVKSYYDRWQGKWSAPVPLTSSEEGLR